MFGVEKNKYKTAAIEDLYRMHLDILTMIILYYAYQWIVNKTYYYLPILIVSTFTTQSALGIRWINNE